MHSSAGSRFPEHRGIVHQDRRPVKIERRAEETLIVRLESPMYCTINP